MLFKNIFAITLSFRSNQSCSTINQNKATDHTKLVLNMMQLAEFKGGKTIMCALIISWDTENGMRRFVVRGRDTITQVTRRAIILLNLPVEISKMLKSKIQILLV